MHDTFWSVNLEKSQCETDRSLLTDHAVEAIGHTASGQHVNLVTHEAHGHPDTYLYDVLDERFPAGAIEWEYIEQCAAVDTWCASTSGIIRVSRRTEPTNPNLPGVTPVGDSIVQ